MSSNTSPPGAAEAPAWRTFRIASATVFLVLLDTTAVVAAPSGLGFLTALLCLPVRARRTAVAAAQPTPAAP